MDERKSNILSEVICQYQQTTLPVGSRVVSRSIGIGVSPATVRNEMAELAQMGFLSQPHPSAGRVPTVRGFRYYLNNLLHAQPTPGMDWSAIGSLFDFTKMGTEEIFRETSRVLSDVSHQTALVLMPQMEYLALRSVYLSPMSGRRILARFAFKDGSMEQRVISNDLKLNRSELNRISNLINEIADGQTLMQIRRHLLDRMQEQYDKLRLKALTLSEKLISGRQQLHINGQSNILDHPEFSRTEVLKRLFRTLEDKNLIIKILDQTLLSPGIRVIIGEEQSVDEIKDCALITGTYGRGATVVGSVGLLGPVRMDYPRLISLVDYISGLISEHLDN